MDCIDGMKQIDDNSIDLVVTSPPYNIGIDYDNYNDKKEWNNYYKWCEKWLKEIYRVLKKDGRFCLNHYLSIGDGNFRTAPLMELNNTSVHKIGFKHHSVAVWPDITLVKRTAWGSFCSASSPYINSPFEGILIMYKNQWKKKNKGESTIKKDMFISSCRGIWNINQEIKGLTKANFHMTLPAICVDLLSYKDDIVLDPFMGSGTTAIICKEKKRKYIGFEISKKYVEIANERIKKWVQVDDWI